MRMRTLFLEFPRLNIAVTFPEVFTANFLAAFSNSINKHKSTPFHHAYLVKSERKDLCLFKDRIFMEKFESVFELISTLEEDIETSLTKNIKEWVAFHAGCVAIKDISCMIVGGPDTGKTTTTFQLIEMGNSHLCEEVTPVDPETMMVHPFPLVLSMSGHYVEEFQSLFPIKEGIVNLIGSQIARYSPYKVLKKPASLKMIIIPAYNLSFLPKIIELSPGKVLTELLQYCFPPNIGEERLFDNVIRIAEKCLILRIHTNGIKQTRNLLEKIIDKYSFPF